QFRESSGCNTRHTLPIGLTDPDVCRPCSGGCLLGDCQPRDMFQIWGNCCIEYRKQARYLWRELLTDLRVGAQIDDLRFESNATVLGAGYRVDNQHSVISD